MAEHWMQKAFGKHPGKLHRELGVPQGEKIPASKLAHAPKRLAKQVALAKTGAKVSRKHAKASNDQHHVGPATPHHRHGINPMKKDGHVPHHSTVAGSSAKYHGVSLKKVSSGMSRAFPERNG
jgi:hypothetical protein